MTFRSAATMGHPDDSQSFDNRMRHSPRVPLRAMRPMFGAPSYIPDFPSCAQNPINPETR